MAARDQLETVDPQGEIRFYDLDPDRGITNIGRHPDNNIVIDSPHVAPFHALVDHRQKPYQIMLLDDACDTTLQGQPLSSNVFRELHDWDCIELDGYSIIYLEGDGGGPRSVSSSMPKVVPVAASAAAPGKPVLVTGPAGVDQPDDVIVTQISPREWTIGVEETATCDVTIINGGDIVANFVVSVEGVDEEWVTITPPEVYLHEAARATVSIAITPPRAPESRAGAHPLTVVVQSPEYPGRVSRTRATLNISPYFEFAVGELSPKQQTVPWRKGSGVASLPVTNRGNSEVPFHLSVEDDEHGCRFEFQIPGEATGLVRNAELRLPPGESQTVPITITPLKRRLIGLHKRTYSYTVTTSQAEGDQIPRSVMGQVSSAPLIGPLIVLLVALLLAALIVGFFKPASVPLLTASVAATERPDVPVTLNYDASRFGSLGSDNIFNRLNALFLQLTMEYQGSDGQWQPVKASPDLSRPDGTLTHVPPGNGKYRLRASNILSQLVPLLGGISNEVPILVTPVEPKIVAFQADHDSVLVGQTVTLHWQVADADTLILSQDGVEETLTDKELERGQRQVKLEKDTIFTLTASNKSWSQPVKLPRTVKALTPTPTPVPTPVIVRFDVAPLSITAGESVTIAWEVTGADTVSIQQLGDGLPLKGEVKAQPEKNALYQLTAIKDAGNGKQVKATSLLQEVTVNPAPTPTAVPVAPEIQLFEATPKEVVAGNSQLVTLAWSVSGATTNIAISAPDLSLTGLKAEDVVSVTVDSTSLFVFTAENGDLKSSKAVEVKALSPTPLPTSPPPTATPFPAPVISYFKAEGVDSASDVIFTGREESNGSAVFVYQVAAGANIKLSWEVKNADKVTLVGFEDQPASGSKMLTAMEAKVYQLTAENNKGSNVSGAFVRIELLPVEAPPAATSLTGTEGSGGTTLTWAYNRTYVEKIAGFRIYRANLAKSNEFSAIATLEDPQARNYQDAISPTCGLAYYVVAVYVDIFDNKEKETDASATSWYTQPCR